MVTHGRCDLACEWVSEFVAGWVDGWEIGGENEPPSEWSVNLQDKASEDKHEKNRNMLAN